ncbi:DNA-binding transcriptional regulator, MarR family [Streptomyces sp. MnatMP-M17]|nr:MarR family transcriptional regulator [Streptomyces sp. SID4917]SCF67483.1 DNA-binding transcriptional regulator, MarR family [Streptomyces sp. MnatMP-M17]
MSQLSVLGRIVERGPITVSELAQAGHVSAQSVAQIVSVLKQQDLVCGEPDLSDGRKTLLRVTDAGRRLVESIVEHRGARLAQPIELHPSESDRATLVAAAAIMSCLADCRLGDHALTGRPAHGRPVAVVLPGGILGCWP